MNEETALFPKTPVNIGQYMRLIFLNTVVVVFSNLLLRRGFLSHTSGVLQNDAL